MLQVALDRSPDDANHDSSGLVYAMEDFRLQAVRVSEQVRK
jgi:hypothetical protein